MITNQPKAMDSSLLSIIYGAVTGIATAILTTIFIMAKYKEKVDTIEKAVTKLQTDLHHTEMELRSCVTKLDERTAAAPKQYTKSESPITVTKEGESVLERSGAKKFILENLAEFTNKVLVKKPKSAYDVQEFSKIVFEEIKDEDRFVTFKNFAFQEGIDLDVLFIVMGITLRDLILPITKFNTEDLENPVR